MENQSFNERHSLTGNSGLLGLTSLRTKLQPVRVKQLLEMFDSDEEDSEERGKDSDNESDNDDIQPLPDDDEQSRNAQSQNAKESNEERANRTHTTDEQNVREQFEEQRKPQETSPSKQETNQEKHIYSSESAHFTSNFVLDEHSHMKLENHRSESLPLESGSAGFFAGSSAPKSLSENNHRSNSNFKPPDMLYTSNNKSSYTLVSSKSESSMQSSHSAVKPKFEAQESNFFSNDRHLHPTNVASQAEPSATSAATTNANYLITDTPHKHNPPVGSMRPTPSISHRSMFQTPQSSKFNHQDYLKNHVQTPATIFGNWSQRHMAQTPMQNRSTILPSDSVRTQAPPNIVTQHTSASTGSMHETPWYQNTEEKKVRRPLAETMRSSVNHQRHSQSEKPPVQYTADSSSASSSKHHDTPSPENSQSHSILENIREQSSNKSAQQQQQHHGMHESKENRNPPALIDKLPTKEDEQGNRENFESIKESKRLSSGGNVSNENRSDAARIHRVESSDTPASRSVRTNSAATPFFIREQSSNKSAQQQQHHGMHESKENRNPSALIDKLSAKEDEQGNRENFESIKESKRLSSSGNVSNENRSDAARIHRVESSDTPASRSVRTNSAATPFFIREQSSKKSAQQQQHHGMHESKENRNPSALIDKLPAKEDEQGNRENFESIKESKRLSSNENVSNENRSDAARIHRVESSDALASRNVRTSSVSAPKSTASETVIEQNNVAPKQQANVQLSIPSSIRRANPGETMMVKGKEYLILGGLGQGMSCHVLRVQDLTSLELRAIKVVNLSRMDKDSAQGCMQEISMLHKLQAPCVVRMFDYEIKYPMVHVVMEMGDTDFRSLLSSMTEDKRLPLTMILYYWTEMLTAVQHIHENGVIHSDLKPANFLLVRGRLKLIDFGIASSINADMTSVVKNSPIGTLNYISPEALMDIGGGGSDSPNHNVKYKITFKSDVWSLGCILYSLVYGYTPFNNFRTQWAKIQAITNPNPKISFTLPAGNDVEPPPAILIDVLRKCLQHDPKARPTVTQLLQIPYITTKPNPRAPIRDIPSNIVLKIRHALTEDEWRQFKEIMEQRRNES